MEYRQYTCDECGSSELIETGRHDEGGNTYYEYKCKACGSVITTYVKGVDTPKAMNTRRVGAMIYEDNIDKIFRIHTMSDAHVTADGTGVSIGNGYIITNAHVVLDGDKPYKRISVMLADDTKGHDAVLVAADMRVDLAILYADTRATAVRFGTETKIGESVYAIGNSMGVGVRITEGIISNYESLEGRIDDDYIVFTSVISGGNSGGPLFNSAGLCVGITSMANMRENRYYFAIPTSEITSFIVKINKKYNMSI